MLLLPRSWSVPSLPSKRRLLLLLLLMGMRSLPRAWVSRRGRSRRRRLGRAWRGLRASTVERSRRRSNGQNQTRGFTTRAGTSEGEFVGECVRACKEDSGKRGAPATDGMDAERRKKRRHPKHSSTRTTTIGIRQSEYLLPGRSNDTVIRFECILGSWQDRETSQVTNTRSRAIAHSCPRRSKPFYRGSALYKSTWPLFCCVALIADR